jgi:hypothetical protein
MRARKTHLCAHTGRVPKNSVLQTKARQCLKKPSVLREWILIGEIIEITSLVCLLFSFPLLIYGKRKREKKKDRKNRRCFFIATKRASGTDT